MWNCSSPYIGGNVNTNVDILLAVSFTILGVIGIIGNSLSFAYFVQSKHRTNIMFILYCTVSVIDTIISIIHVPTTVALFRQRKGGVYCIEAFCGLWRNVFKTVQRLSIALVLEITVTRTIIITNPLAVITVKNIIYPLLAYCLYLFIEMAIFVPRQKYVYGHGVVYCFEAYEGPYKTKAQWVYSLKAVTLGIPAITIFISFLVSVYTLNKSSCAVNPECANHYRHKATITVLLFTFIYMLCNLPYFLNMVHWIYKILFRQSNQEVTVFMDYYSWIISELMGLLINAVANTFLYWIKITSFQSWVKRRFNNLIMRCRSF